MISVFVHFLCGSRKSLFPQKRLDTLLCPHSVLLMFPLFPKILSLKSFSNSWGNSCIKFLMLDIAFHVSSGIIKLRKIPKYYKRDCREFLLSSSLAMIVQNAINQWQFVYITASSWLFLDTWWISDMFIYP